MSLEDKIDTLVTAIDKLIDVETRRLVSAQSVIAKLEGETPAPKVAEPKGKAAASTKTAAKQTPAPKAAEPDPDEGEEDEGDEDAATGTTASSISAEKLSVKVREWVMAGAYVLDKDTEEPINPETGEVLSDEETDKIDKRVNARKNFIKAATARAATLAGQKNPEKMLLAGLNEVGRAKVAAWLDRRIAGEKIDLAEED